MEDIIRFRLSVKQLDSNEFNTFVNKFGKDELISFMMKGFLFMHKNSQNQNNETASIANDIISNIIESREINSNENTSKNKSFKINKLPNVLIRECASYLNVIDYLNFSKCDGLIYIASNSPASLQKLDMTEHGYPNNLNKFPLLKTICFNPAEFIKKYNDSSVVLNNIKSLELDMSWRNNHPEIVTFANMKCIDFSKINELTFSRIGWEDDRYDFNLFCEFLLKFPNVNSLSISNIYFDEFTNTNNIISQLFPKLKAFRCRCYNMNANTFRDKLIETHSKQITHLNYDEGITVLNSDSIQSLKLKELMAYRPNIDTVSQIIKQSPELERIFLHLNKIEANNANNKKTKNIITSLYAKHAKLNEVQLCMSIEQFDKIIEGTEIGLSNSQCVEHKYLIIIYEVYYAPTEIPMDQIDLNLTRIVNALLLGLTKHFMIVFILRGNTDRIDMNKKEELVNKLKTKCLVFEKIENQFEQKIIVTNKDCIINGYQKIYW